MPYRRFSKLLAAAAVLGALAAAPVHASARDSGVGRDIAAQGNQALRAIRADLKARLLTVRPQLPRHAARLAAGGALPTATTVRCAE